jgi:hypothetical protein
VSDKLPERTKDYLSVKNDVNMILTREAYLASFKQWADSQMAERGVKYYDDAIWGLVNKEAYTNVNGQSGANEGS